MGWQLDPANQLLLHLVDQSGIRSTNGYWIAPGQVDPAGGAAAAIASGVQGITQSFVSGAEILRRAHQDATVVPTDGPYPRAADKVALTFAAASGRKVRMEIPGPNETILDAGHINIDQADAAMSAFIDYVIANCVDDDGSVIIALTRGYRRRPPRLKKQ